MSVETWESVSSETQLKDGMKVRVTLDDRAIIGRLELRSDGTWFLGSYEIGWYLEQGCTVEHEAAPASAAYAPSHQSDYFSGESPYFTSESKRTTPKPKDVLPKPIRGWLWVSIFWSISFSFLAYWSIARFTDAEASARDFVASYLGIGIIAGAVFLVMLIGDRKRKLRTYFRVVLPWILAFDVILSIFTIGGVLLVFFGVVDS